MPDLPLSRARQRLQVLAQWLAWLWLLIDRRLQLHVLRCFQQITAILHQQVQSIDDVGDVFEVGVATERTLEVSVISSNKHMV